MGRWLALINRSAGRKSPDLAEVEALLAGTNIEFELVAPDTRSAAQAMVQEAAERGIRNFIAGGGDGTVNAVVNAVMALDIGTKPVLGVLPLGTGCDLLRTFGLPNDPESAARHLGSPETYDIDVVVLTGAWGTHYYANVAQAGVGAAAAETAPKLMRSLGIARYPLAFGTRLPRFPRAKIRLKTERREIESEALAVIMANAQFFAGGWNVAPKATLVDGVIDIQIFDVKKTEAPSLVPKIIKGTHLRSPGVRRLSAAEFSLEVDRDWPLEADGDYLGNTPVTGRVVPAAISLKI